MSSPVTLTSHEHYSLLQMDDGKANAIGFDMLSALNAALDEAEAAGKVIVIAGRPGKFSAGFDLTVMGQGGEPMFDLLRGGAALSQRLLRCPLPVVLAVSGHALAMGALLLLSADYRVGIEGEFRIGLNEVAIGMALPRFGVELARERLSPLAMEKSVNLARLFDAPAAAGAGYLDEAVAPESLMARVDALAAELAALDMNAHKLTKQRVRQPFLARLETAIEEDFRAAASLLS